MDDTSTSKVAKIITFKVADHWFALPMDTVLKIVNCPSPNRGGMVNLGLVQLGSHTIHLLDVYRTVGLSSGAEPLGQPPFLLVLRNNQKKLWGLPLEAPPDLIELPCKVFNPVSTDKHFMSKKQWISHIAVISDQTTNRTLLLLDLKGFFQSEAA
ncbi:MAG: chemotaxis protein CheW [Cyanobacteria bacterium P01_H01_bin.105]